MTSRADQSRIGVKDPNNPCLFCTPRGVTRQNELAYCARDSYPISPGHSLIIPLRHCADFFDLTPEEMHACMGLLVLERAALNEELKPNGYNVGINIGKAGGQSVFHVHIHLIPRYQGDHPRPRGGVRQIIPDKADYPRGNFVESLRGKFSVACCVEFISFTKSVIPACF